jgi:hypothetical protein
MNNPHALTPGDILIPHPDYCFAMKVTHVAPITPHEFTPATYLVGHYRIQCARLDLDPETRTPLQPRGGDGFLYSLLQTGPDTFSEFDIYWREDQIVFTRHRPPHQQLSFF